LRYFGSWNTDLVERDFTKEQLLDFTVRKQILFESSNKDEVSQKESEYIRALDATDPEIGYNQRF